MEFGAKADLDSGGDEDESSSGHAVYGEVREEAQQELGYGARGEGQGGQQRAVALQVVRLEERRDVDLKGPGLVACLNLFNADQDRGDRRWGSK